MAIVTSASNFTGLSTDTKTSQGEGCIFLETDTLKTYRMTNGAWVLQTNSIYSMGGDIPLTLISPTISETINAGYSAIVGRSYAIASGMKLILGLNSRFRIL